jgi:hypothetical protein
MAWGEKMKLYWRIKKNGKWTWKAADELYYLDKECKNIIVRSIRTKVHQEEE